MQPNAVDQSKPYTQTELVFGLVAPVGTHLDDFIGQLQEALELEKRGYRCGEPIRFTKFAEAVKGLNKELPSPNADRYTRTTMLIARCNELREIYGNDVLSLYAAAEIASRRPKKAPRHLPAHAFIARQLKRPEEVTRLRQIYSEGFHLIGLYCPESVREQHLKDEGMDERAAKQLIKTDAEQPIKWGQRVRETFHLSDVFMDVSDIKEVPPQIDRFLNLLFGVQISSPQPDEYGMFMAYAASLRSASLSRQVGAAILSPDRELLAVGTNEVPSYKGGLYWGDERADDGTSLDGRDHNRRDEYGKVRDSTDAMQELILREIFERLELSDFAREHDGDEIAGIFRRLEDTRVMGLTEFGRAVHAEMDALTSAARVGVSVRDSTLYTTTFPCHACAKHIVAAGIRHVVYIEPYAKSLALELHDDSISHQPPPDQRDRQRKVIFEPFVGVSPRRYLDLFSSVSREGVRIRRKDKAGYLDEDALGLRLQLSPYSYLQRESIAAKQLKAKIPAGKVRHQQRKTARKNR